MEYGFSEKVKQSNRPEDCFTPIVSYRDKHGRRVYIVRVGSWDPDEVSVSMAISAACNMIELISLEPKTQIAGFTCVYDAGGYGYKHMTAMSMMEMRNLTKISEVCVHVG